jgi:hypothetical protein
MKRTTWIFLALLVVVLATYFILKYKQVNSTGPAPTPTNPIYLLSAADGTLVRLEVEDNHNNIVQVERESAGVWYLTKPVRAAADQGKVGAAETQVGALRIASSFTTPPDLAAAGLLDPVYVIHLGYDSGTVHTLAIGGLAPTGHGYYVRFDQGSVYILSQAGIDALVQMVAAPPFEPTATITLEPTSTNPLETETPTP